MPPAWEWTKRKLGNPGYEGNVWLIIQLFLNRPWNFLSVNQKIFSFQMERFDLFFMQGSFWKSFLFWLLKRWFRWKEVFFQTCLKRWFAPISYWDYDLIGWSVLCRYQFFTKLTRNNSSPTFLTDRWAKYGQVWVHQSVYFRVPAIGKDFRGQIFEVNIMVWLYFEQCIERLLSFSFQIIKKWVYTMVLKFDIRYIIYR